MAHSLVLFRKISVVRSHAGDQQAVKGREYGDKKKDTIHANGILHIAICINLLYLINDGLESLGIIDSEVSKHLTVDFNSCLVQSTHQC